MSETADIAETEAALSAYDVVVVTVEKTIYRVHASSPEAAETEAVVGHGVVVTTEVVEYDVTSTSEADDSTPVPPGGRPGA